MKIFRNLSLIFTMLGMLLAVGPIQPRVTGGRRQGSSRRTARATGRAQVRPQQRSRAVQRRRPESRRRQNRAVVPSPAQPRRRQGSRRRHQGRAARPSMSRPRRQRRRRAPRSRPRTQPRIPAQDQATQFDPDLARAIALSLEGHPQWPAPQAQSRPARTHVRNPHRPEHPRVQNHSMGNQAFQNRLRGLSTQQLNLPSSLRGRPGLLHLATPRQDLYNPWACVMHAIHRMIRVEEAFGMGEQIRLDQAMFEYTCSANMASPGRIGNNVEMHRVSHQLVENPALYLHWHNGNIGCCRNEDWQGGGQFCLGPAHALKHIAAPDQIVYNVPYRGANNSVVARAIEIQRDGYVAALNRYLNLPGARIVHVACLVPGHVFTAHIIKSPSGERSMRIFDNLNRPFASGSPSAQITQFVYNSFMVR